MTKWDGKSVFEKTKGLVERSRHVGTNVTHYTGPELGRLALLSGQRNVNGGYNWDTRVRSRSAPYSVVIGSEKVALAKLSDTLKETMDSLDQQMARVFGGKFGAKEFPGHANYLPIDLIHRVMGSGEDKDFVFNCYLLVATKERKNHHIGYMWGKMLREVEPAPDADSLYILMIPDINTGPMGRFYAFPEEGVTIGIGSDYMGECKKGFLRMAMWKARQRGILGIHAGVKIVRAYDQRSRDFRRYGVCILGNSGTGKTTNTGHTHYLDREGEQSLVVQDDFAGLRLKDGRVLGTEVGLFLKTDLDEDDMLLRPLTQSSDFTSQNLYVDYMGEIQYLQEDLCANGRGIVPIKKLPEDRRYSSIDLPPLDELDGLYIIFNTRHSQVVPILQELTHAQAAAYFMLGESIETAAGDPKKAGMATRTVGTNPFLVGDPAEEGNLFFNFLKSRPDKVRTFLLNTGGVGEIPNPEDRTKPHRKANRPMKPGIGFITRALFRGTGVWEKSPDFGTKVLRDGVTDERGDLMDMDPYDPMKQYDEDTRREMVARLNRERVECLEKYDKLDPEVLKVLKATHFLG